MRGILTAICIAFYVIALTNSFPTKSRSHRERNSFTKRIHSLLEVASVLSYQVSRQSFQISQEVSRRWPIDPHQGSTVDFFLPHGNKTAIKPLTILKMKHRVLEKCISLMDDSTDELNRFPAARGVAQKVIRLKEKTQKLMLCLKQTMLLIKLRTARVHRGENKPAHALETNVHKVNTTSLTIEDAAHRTKFFMDELSSSVINDLIVDIWLVTKLMKN
ncbi:uncharacterized protein LOC114961842 [Acropora millepora]|uniref:uncharacterized protein LOC114961842 n=1 Tax=Acropora millepora TaxID=45264 RepID=UPI001CF582AE|nr:uncharacterized protein LOC114961842 [Acropora millepora]